MPCQCYSTILNCAWQTKTWQPKVRLSSISYGIALWLFIKTSSKYVSLFHILSQKALLAVARQWDICQTKTKKKQAFFLCLFPNCENDMSYIKA